MYVGTLVPLASHHFMVPYVKNERFIGRDNLLAQLFEKLREQKPYEYNHRVALYGLGGVGKTQTALAYVYANRTCYDSIFWISGTSKASLLSDFQRIAILTKCTADGTNTDPLQGVKEVHAWLEKQTSWLLIIDNLDDIKVIPGFLPMNDTKKHTIITTRNPDSEGIPAQGLEVGLLDPADAVFLSTLSKITIKDTLESKQAYQIVQELGYLPLALEQAAAYVREVAGTFATFLEDYTNIHKDIHKWIPHGNRPYYSHSVATTWSMSFKIVRNNHPQSAALFQLLSFPNPDGILIDLLVAEAEVLDQDMQKVVSNQIDRAKALLELEKFSLLKWDRQNKALVIHRLVQRVVQDEISDADLETLSVTIVELCGRLFPQDWENENRALCRICLGQVMTPLFCLEGTLRTRNSATTRVRWSKIMYRVGQFLMADGKLSDSERFSSKAVEFNTEVLGEDHSDTLMSMNSLAETYWTQGRTEEALQLHKRVLEKRRRILGEDHPDTLESMDNLAVTYSTQGRTEEALRLHEQVVEKRRHILGEDHRDRLTSMNNLAMAYKAQGRKEDCTRLNEEVLEKRRRTLGEDHLQTLISMNNLALAYCAQRRMEDSTGLVEQVLEKRRRILGEDHPDTLTSMNNLATVYLAQVGRMNDAARLLEHVLERRRRILDEDHPDTVTVKNNLAFAYWEQGRRKEAATLNEQVLEKRRQMLGEDHPDTLKSMKRSTEWLAFIQAQH